MGEGQRKVAIVALLGAIAVSAGVGAGSLRRAPPPTSMEVVSSSVAEGAAGTIDVHVAGWVVAPGVVSVPDGSIVADAVEAAGGLRVGAMADQVNLAAPASDGQQIVVPGPDSPATGHPGPDAGGLIRLNSATAAELEELPGVGPVLAERIVAYREDNGPYRTVEDLLQVSGIGEAKLSSIRDLVQP